mmetsp:Transcript_1052/g.2370  ORF Transcript_1052/g.2370 Transcript_1052/m.2370 type:complete len:282 (+) Transcript_1052:2-847(+)
MHLSTWERFLAVGRAAVLEESSPRADRLSLGVIWWVKERVAGEENVLRKAEDRDPRQGWNMHLSTWGGPEAGTAQEQEGRLRAAGWQVDEQHLVHNHLPAPPKEPLHRHLPQSWAQGPRGGCGCGIGSRVTGAGRDGSNHLPFGKPQARGGRVQGPGEARPGGAQEPVEDGQGARGVRDELQRVGEPGGCTAHLCQGGRDQGPGADDCGRDWLWPGRGDHVPLDVQGTAGRARVSERQDCDKGRRGGCARGQGCSVRGAVQVACARVVPGAARRSLPEAPH